MTPGTRVRLLGVPYEGRTGVVVHVNPEGPTFANWPLWVDVDGNDGCHPVGFTEAEVVVEATA